MVETVGATNFKAYLRLAESAGIIAVEHCQDGDGWVTFSHKWKANPNNSPQRAGLRFRDLIEILNDLRLAGVSEPRFFTVGARLRRNNPSIYKGAGVTKFEEYAQAAEEAGVVTIRGVRNGDGLLKLCPVYCSSPVCPSTPMRAVSIPPTPAASTALPFAPLVDFLRSKQSTRSQPISFSEVFAHFVMTRGYAGLVSLCTSVPGVTTFGRYIDAAIDSGLVSLVGGTTTSGSRLVLSSDAGRARGVGLWLPDSPSPPAQRSVSTTPLLSSPSSPEIMVSPPLVKATSDSFLDLAVVLRELQASTGESAFRFSNVIPLLLERKTNPYASVGLGSFADYVTLAMESGVVRAEWTDQADGWVTLTDPRPGRPVAPLRSSKSSGVVTVLPPPRSAVDPQFVDLVETLREIWKNGDEKPLLSLVGTDLLKDAGRRARTLIASGAKSFKAYAELAKGARIVDIRYGRAAKETRMLLNPTLRVYT